MPSDVDVVCRQPVCHYAAPSLLGGIKTNATWTHMQLISIQWFYCMMEPVMTILPSSLIVACTVVASSFSSMSNCFCVLDVVT